MNREIRDEVYSQVKKWVLEAGEMIRIRMKDPLIIHTKSNPNDLVTTVDKEIEQFLANRIKETYQDHYIFSEEGYGDSIKTLEGTVWIIDPIDGTMNFVHQKRNFAISVGIYFQGIGEIGLIYNVMDNILYSAVRGKGAYKNDVKLPPLKKQATLEEAILGLKHFWLCENRLVNKMEMERLVRKVRGTRTYGSAALEFAYVAEGILDGYLTMSLAPWDIAAGMIIVDEVGGITTNAFGGAINMIGRNSVLTCNPAIKDDLVQNFLVKGKK